MALLPRHSETKTASRPGWFATREGAVKQCSHLGHTHGGEWVPVEASPIKGGDLKQPRYVKDAPPPKSDGYRPEVAATKEELRRNAAAALGDKVYRPAHYARWKIEPITFIMLNDMEYWRGAICKYAARAG